jgi:hypothetical protein
MNDALLFVFACSIGIVLGVIGFGCWMAHKIMFQKVCPVCGSNTSLEALGIKQINTTKITGMFQKK